MNKTMETLSNKKIVGKKEEFELLSLIDNCKQIPNGDKLILRERLKSSEYEIISILRAQKKKPDMMLLSQHLRKYIAKIKENPQRTKRCETEPVILNTTITEEKKFLVPLTDQSIDKGGGFSSRNLNHMPSTVSITNKSPSRADSNKQFIKFSDPFLQNRIRELQMRYDSNSSFRTNVTESTRRELYAVNSLGGSSSIWRLPNGAISSIQSRGSNKERSSSVRGSKERVSPRPSSKERGSKQNYQTPKKLNKSPQVKNNATPSPHYQKRVVFNLEKTERKIESPSPSSLSNKSTASKRFPVDMTNSKTKELRKDGLTQRNNSRSDKDFRSRCGEKSKSPQPGRILRPNQNVRHSPRESKPKIDLILLKALGEKWRLVNFSAEEIFCKIFDDPIFTRISKPFFRMKMEGFLLEINSGHSNNISGSSIDLFFETCDLKKDQFLDPEEFGQCLQIICDRHVDRNIMKLCFVAFDSENNGFIPKASLKQALISSLPMGQSNEVYSERMLQRMLEQLRFYEDEQITYWSIFLMREETLVKDVFESLRPILIRRNLL